MLEGMILVTGGTGFVGRAVVRRLLAEGHRVRVLARRPPAGGGLSQPGCSFHTGSVLDPASLETALEGVASAVHLVGIICERGPQTFRAVHAGGTRNIVAACQKAGVRRLLHMSASGTRAHAVSAYHRTKWEGECAVRDSGLDWTIFRPAIIYGPGDGFCSVFVRQLTPPLGWLTQGVIPVIEGGHTLLQPVHVDEVAAAFARALAVPASIGKTYELGGNPLPMVDLLRALAAHHGRPFHPLPVPRELAYAGAWLIEALSPVKMPTPGHVAMLEEDQNADTSPAAGDLGFAPLPFSAGLARAGQSSPGSG